MAATPAEYLPTTLHSEVTLLAHELDTMTARIAEIRRQIAENGRAQDSGGNLAQTAAKVETRVAKIEALSIAAGVLGVDEDLLMKALSGNLYR